MDPASALCWLQQAYHLDRAASSNLENVRIIAERAAKAWGVEALAAENREARHAQVRAVSNMLTARKRDARAQAEAALSEKGRGRSDPPTRIISAENPEGVI